MMNIGRVAETSAMTATTAPKAAERVSEEKTTTMATDHTDKFVRSETGYTPAYTKAANTDNRSKNSQNDGTGAKNGENAKKAEKGNPAFVNKSSLQMKNEGMKDIVANMLSGQASGTKNLNGINSVLAKFGLTPIQSDGSDDFWGAEKTANRILDFAKSLAGDNDEAFGTLKSAVEKAFGDCEGIWGGKLPSVCYDTYDLIKKGFDSWEQEIAARKAESGSAYADIGAEK